MSLVGMFHTFCLHHFHWHYGSDLYAASVLVLVACGRFETGPCGVHGQLSFKRATRSFTTQQVCYVDLRISLVSLDLSHYSHEAH